MTPERFRLRFQRAAFAAYLAVALAGCGVGTEVGSPDNVTMAFRVVGGQPPASAAAGAARVGPALVAGPPMSIEGTNGTLTITEIRLIIDEVELKRIDGSCDDDAALGGSDDDGHGDCDEFEAPPRFLDLPLDGEPIEALTAPVPPGTYDELEFEIEDLEDDEDDSARATEIAALRAEILSELADWPRKASAMVAGSFTPTGASAIDFRVYIDAEIEIEMDLLPHLVVGEDGTASRALTVEVRPDLWFLRPDGSVLPLHLHDYATTGELLEIEVEMEHGFTKIEID